HAGAHGNGVPRRSDWWPDHRYVPAHLPDGGRGVMSTLAFIGNEPWLAALSLVVLGLLIGSFLNVVILRFPIMLFRGWKRDCEDRKSTRLNSSHVKISYAVFCLK